ncbi:hypothetical protein PanWU01x14_248550, partial [Parasponia andersonii]
MSASTHAHEVRRVPWPPQPRTAEMRFSEGGDDISCVVARRTATRKEDAWRLVERVALTREALSLRMPTRLRSFLRLIIIPIYEIGRWVDVGHMLYIYKGMQTRLYIFYFSVVLYMYFVIINCKGN